MTLPAGAVLIVEDDDAQRFLIRNVVADVLEGTGCAVEAVAGAVEALARPSPPHGERLLVITDYRMPGLDGVGLVRRLRDRPGGALNRYVVFTSYAPLVGDPAARIAGVDHVVLKPEDAYACRDAVRAVVLQWLEGRPSGAPLLQAYAAGSG